MWELQSGIPDPLGDTGDVLVLFSSPPGSTSLTASGWPGGVFISAVTDCCWIGEGAGGWPKSLMAPRGPVSRVNNRVTAVCCCRPWKKHSAQRGDLSTCMNVLWRCWITGWAAFFPQSGFIHTDCRRPASPSLAVIWNLSSLKSAQCCVRGLRRHWR